MQAIRYFTLTALVLLLSACASQQKETPTGTGEAVASADRVAGAPRSTRMNPSQQIAARAQWRFSGSALRRARLAFSLARDLEVNPPGVALALDLIDEIGALRAMLHRMGR